MADNETFCEDEYLNEKLEEIEEIVSSFSNKSDSSNDPEAQIATGVKSKGSSNKSSKLSKNGANDDDDAKSNASNESSHSSNSSSSSTEGTTLKPPSIMKTWRMCSETTSMHGLNHAVNSPRWWKRLFWSILVMGAAAFATNSLRLTFQDYLQGTLTTVVTLQPRQRVQFPNISVCNLNFPFAYNKLRPDIKSAMHNLTLVETGPKKLLQGFQQILQRYNYPRDYNEYFNGAVKLSNDVFHCTLNRVKCDPQILVSKTLWCVDLKKENYIMRAGRKNAFVLEFSIGEDDYLPYQPEVGAQVFIGSHSTDPEDEGIQIRPGASTSIGLTEVTVYYPEGECIPGDKMIKRKIGKFDIADSRYETQMKCYQYCKESAFVERCECCYFSCPKIGHPVSNVTECAKFAFSNKQKCIDDVKKEWEMGKMPCMDRCLPECHQKTYRTQYTQTGWPSKQELDMIKTNDKLKNVGNLSVVNEEYARRNFVRLQVYFDTLTEEISMTMKTYSWSRLLAAIGGTLGLWLGFSLMTAVEFLELASDMVTRFAYRVVKCLVGFVGCCCRRKPQPTEC